MKFAKRLAVAGMTALALVGTTACSSSKTSSTKSNTTSSVKIPKVTKKTTVVFWHAMTGVQQATLQKLTAEFEKRILTLLLSWKIKVHILIYKQKSIQPYNHQIIYQLSLKHIQVGYGMLLTIRC